MRYYLDEKAGNQLSILGFGCMRFPRKMGQIDMKKTEELIVKAVEGGVNYFDTAYIYPGSEQALGTILQENKLREKVHIATKLPFSRCKTYEDFEKLFTEELARLKTDYIDYYLIHNICDAQSWDRVCALGIEKWIAEKKASGQIRRIGYSSHAAQDQFLALLDRYAWDFCQIQYNYVNTNYQAGTVGLHKAAEKGIPVIVMEPLLGGKLAGGLPEKAKAQFAKVDVGLSPAAWAFRWLWNQKEVAVVLSGMNDLLQLEENIQIAQKSEPGMFSSEEAEVFISVEKAFHEAFRVPCTSCNYCMPCPQKINIPGCFTAYNFSYAVGRFSGIQQYMTGIAGFSYQNDRSPTKCTQCGRCEKLCPQHIPIIKSLQQAQKRLEPAPLRVIRKAMVNRGKKSG